MLSRLELTFPHYLGVYNDCSNVLSQGDGGWEDVKRVTLRGSSSGSSRPLQNDRHPF
jgi:hypothetical protein